MSFMEKTVNQSLPIWDRCTRTPFIRRLADGTLPAVWFRDYMVQDSIYLKHYARVYGQMIYRAESLEDIRVCYAALGFVTQGESEVRLRYLARYGLADADMERLQPLPENQAYLDFLLETAAKGDFREMLMAVLPCMLSYSYIFQKLSAGQDCAQSPYLDFILDYAEEEYAAGCRALSRFAEEKCRTLPPETLARLDGIFQRGSELELLFWQMAGKEAEGGAV